MKIAGIQVVRLRVQRFKNLEDASFDLAPVNVLVGGNNAGKSAVIQAVQFSVSAAQCVSAKSRIEKPSGSGKYVSTVAPNKLYYSPVDEVMSLSNGKPLTQKEEDGIRLEFSLESTDGDEPASIVVYINVAKGKNGNLAIRSNAEAKIWDILNSLEYPFSMYVPGLAGIAPQEPYVTPAAVRKAAARGHGNSILRNVLWQLQKYDEYAWDNFHMQLRDVFPGYEVEVSHEPQDDELVYAWLKGPTGYLPLGLAGTGQLQVIQILAYMNLYSPRLLLLDEPDAHIHPDKQRALLRVICDWADDYDAKVLIATHSRHLLDTLEGDARFHWMQNGQRQNEDDFDRVRVLMDLGALDRSDRLKNGHVHAVVLTEDSNAADSSKKKSNNPLRRLLDANGLDLDRTQVWSYEGCTQLHTATVLAEFIRDTAPGVDILVHRDRDYLSDTQVDDFRAGYAKKGLDVFVTTGTDVESHFLDVHHLQAVTGLAAGSVESLLKEATRTARKHSLDTYARDEMVRARRQRQADGKSGEPSPMDVAARCEDEFTKNPSRYRHGKNTLKAVRQLLQEQHGLQPDLLAPSNHLADPVLTSFADRLSASTTNTSNVQ